MADHYEEADAAAARTLDLGIATGLELAAENVEARIRDRRGDWSELAEELRRRAAQYRARSEPR
jgi:hypothetical protein